MSGAIDTGLGASIARRFALGGYTVALVSRKKESLLPVAEAIAKEGGKALSVTADTSASCSLCRLFTNRILHFLISVFYHEYTAISSCVLHA